MRVISVYTPPVCRRRGYAGTLVAELSQRLLDRGHEFCCLFTNADDHTPNHIYMKIGSEPVMDFVSYRFG